MNAQLDTTKISNNEALDHALIQCLRLFAQHGRKLRNLETQPMKRVSDDVLVMEESDHKENGEIELIHS